MGGKVQAVTRAADSRPIPDGRKTKGAVMTAEIERESPPRDIPALTAQDYRKIRRGLLLGFWGLLYVPLLALFTGVFSFAGPYSGLLVGTVSTALVLMGLTILFGVCPDSRYEWYLRIAILSAGISWAEHVASQFTPVPEPLKAALSSLSAVAAVCFLLGLRRLITYTHWWEKILTRLRVDIILVILFWAGPSLFTIVESFLPAEPWFFAAAVLSVFLLVVAQIASLFHLWRTLQAIHQDAGLRNNVLVIRKRRRRAQAMSRASSAALSPEGVAGQQGPDRLQAGASADTPGSGAEGPSDPPDRQASP